MIFAMRYLRGLGLLSVSLVCCFGCAHVHIKNTTPEVLPVNASGVYSLAMDFSVLSSGVNERSIVARVCVDGRMLPMKRVSRGHYIYEYRMPADRTSVPYFFEVNYSRQTDGGLQHICEKSPTHQLSLSDHYALGMDTQRGTPGTVVTVIGRGFREGDTIYVDEQAMETKLVSPTALRFRIPPLAADRHYTVELANANETLPVGKILIDRGIIRTSPRALEIPKGKSAELVISLSSQAPGEGVEIDVTTDIPDAVFVPDVIVRGGKNSTTAIIEGAEPARGTLFLRADGFMETAVPVVIYGTESEKR
ncbi:MAG: IPT/TIG domain-containing protein [Puniceicoccales bacterium]|nr:IPT/TIG domain-containing protein [Puniceicoccales bacterium]